MLSTRGGAVRWLGKDSARTITLLCGSRRHVVLEVAHTNFRLWVAFADGTMARISILAKQPNNNHRYYLLVSPSTEVEVIKS